MTNALVDRLFSGIEWTALPEPTEASTEDGLPYATHEGILKIGDSVLMCYQLSTGQRVITAESFERFMGVLTSSNGDILAPERTPEAKA